MKAIIKNKFYLPQKNKSSNIKDFRREVDRVLCEYDSCPSGDCVSISALEG